METETGPRLDPTSLARSAHYPTLIVRGSQDGGISPTDAKLLADALGPPAQVLVAAGASRTLSITTKTALGAPTPSSPAGMQDMQDIHLRDGTITISRDVATLGAIGDWIRSPAPRLIGEL